MTMITVKVKILNPRVEQEINVIQCESLEDAENHFSKEECLVIINKYLVQKAREQWYNKITKSLMKGEK